MVAYQVYIFIYIYISGVVFINSSALKALRDLSAALEGDAWIVIPPLINGNLCVRVERFDGHKKLNIQQAFSAEELEIADEGLGQHFVEKTNQHFKECLKYLPEKGKRK